MVTNPLSRDWTVTASLFATLNEMFGNRTVCGIGRGDSSVRVVGGSPAKLSTLAEAMRVIKGLGRGSNRHLPGSSPRDPMGARRLARHLDGRLRTEGARPCRARDRRADPSARRPVPDRVVGPPRQRGQGGGRACRLTLSRFARRRPPMSEMTFRISASRCAGSAGWSATTSPTSWRDTGPDREPCRRPSPTTSPTGSSTTTAITASPGNPSTEFVPDDVIDRFCVLGPVSAHIERMAELESIGVDQFAIYLMHDAQEATLARVRERGHPELPLGLVPGPWPGTARGPTALPSRPTGLSRQAAGSIPHDWAAHQRAAVTR